MKIRIDEIKELCIKILMKSGLDKEDAETVVKECLYGELIGRKSHGFASFPKIVLEKIRSRKGNPRIIKEEDKYALIDANGNLGQIAGRSAMELAIKKAAKTGIALVGINKMESYLMPGYYAKLASEKDMIGIVMNNSRSRVSPFGGTEPKLGTNPISISIPTNDIPLVVDMATATRAMGEVRLAKKLGNPLPEGMALDRNGEPTREPDKVHSLTPFGGYKGYGLCLAIEILAGSFVQAKMGKEIKDDLDRGYLFLVIDPKIFIDIATFKKEISELVQDIRSSRTSIGFENILIPGERADKVMAKNLQSGVLDIEDSIIHDIKKLL